MFELQLQLLKIRGIFLLCDLQQLPLRLQDFHSHVVRCLVARIMGAIHSLPLEGMLWKVYYIGIVSGRRK